MEKHIIFLALLLLSSQHIPVKISAESALDSDPNPTNFIKEECQSTRYPALCIGSLSTYSATIQESHWSLARTALSVSLTRALFVSSFVSKMIKAKGMKPIVVRATKDCIDNIGNTVDQLTSSIKELERMKRPMNGQDFIWHVSNVQTWVSSALTDQTTCLDGFSGPAMDGYVKVAIRGRVSYCAQVTSNALALVNRFAATHA
ncbi:21 kDa protein precursor [Dorcoceras hygrometricum]|uniref:21 kDa protein n=1 Tax=Dorcoceras hygrometricum TaxID=472368 RepID=A0A2Z7C249_9LAMI|nr:21 kDa protein precursor [Dorcoceras hygrometricum]